MKIKVIIAAIGLSSALIIPGISSAALDIDSSEVSMNIGLYASLTGLNDFTLSPAGIDGDKNTIYSGSDDFKLESNGQVHVSMTGGDLSNGVDSVSTIYNLDSAGLAFDTVIDATHNAFHTVSAVATLGDISSQKSGSYVSEIVLTVSAI